MARTCPWCCEPLPRGASADGSCPHCQRRLVDGGGGHELRDIDVRYDQVEANQRDRLRSLLVFGSVTVAVVTFLLPLLHAASVLMVPVLVAAHLLAIRLWLIADGRRLLGPRRRIFTRWVVRLTFVWIGVPGYGLAAVPLIGPVFGVATFAGLTWAAHAYTAWSLRRELERQPMMAWELLVLITLATVTVALLLALVAGGALVGWSLARLIELLTAGNGG